MTTNPRSRRDVDRATSPVVGFVLLVGLVALGVGTTLLVGGGALTDLQGTVDAENAEVQMANLDAQTSRVVLGQDRSHRFRFGGDGTATVNERAGTVTVEQVGCADCPTELARTTLGAVEYRTGDTTVAYQGGGVWRTDGEGARMVSPPEFHYQWTAGSSGEPTLTFPLVVVRGETATTDELRLRKGASTSVFPNPAENRSNPLGTGSLLVTIESEYYRGWAEYFEERTNAESVTVDDRAETVEVLLAVPHKTRRITDGIASRESALTVQGSASVDSYDSSVGSYVDTRGSEGSVYVGNDLDNAGNGVVHGDMRVDGDFRGGGGIDVKGRLVADGDVTLQGGVSSEAEIVVDGDLTVGGGTTIGGPVTVSGSVTDSGGVVVDAPVVAGRDYHFGGTAINADVHVGGDFHQGYGTVDADLTTGGAYHGDRNAVHGDLVENAPHPDLSAVEEASTLTPPDLRPIDGIVEGRVEEYARENDNAGSDAARVEAGECGGAHSSCTLTAGRYSLDEFDLSGSDRVRFDTTDGPVFLAVDGDVRTTGGSEVTVVGPDEVHVYATGNYEVKTDWRSADAHGDRGDQIWLYGTSSSTVTVQGGTAFYGVLYAPGNEDIQVRGGSEVYGGVVGSVSAVQGNSAVHYDLALADEEPAFADGERAPLTYLHVSLNEVVVDD